VAAAQEKRPGTQHTNAVRAIVALLAVVAVVVLAGLAWLWLFGRQPRGRREGSSNVAPLPERTPAPAPKKAGTAPKKTGP